MRRLILALLLAGCFEEPSYEGRFCDESVGCPSGYRCVDGRCTNRPPVPLDSGISIEEDAGALVEDAGLTKGDAGTIDTDSGTPDTGEPDGGTPDAGDPAIERCDDPIAYPTIGWEVRHFTLGPSFTFDQCFGVEDLSTDGIDRDYRGAGPFNGTITDFGSRYTATRTFAEGIHTFLVDHDDGIRIRIDGAILYERWEPGAVEGVRAYSAYLTAGAHQIEVEHFDNMGWAQIAVSWERGCAGLPMPESGWLITYHGYDPTSRTLIYDQCYGFGIVASSFLSLSAPQLQSYGIVGRSVQTFRGMTSLDFTYADGMRVDIGGVRVVDDWVSGGTNSVNLQRYLPLPAEVRFEHFSLSPSALSISWENVCDQVPAIPTTSWWVRYYRILYTANPESWTIDRDDCLGAQYIAGERLMQSGEPPQIMSLGITGLWGAEFFGRRTFAEQTTVSTTYDDGIRIFDGGVQVYADWYGPQVESASLLFGAGTHDFRIEYMQNFGGTQIQFTW